MTTPTLPRKWHPRGGGGSILRTCNVCGFKGFADSLSPKYQIVVRGGDWLCQRCWIWRSWWDMHEKILTYDSPWKRRPPGGGEADA